MPLSDGQVGALTFLEIEATIRNLQSDYRLESNFYTDMFRNIRKECSKIWNSPENAIPAHCNEYENAIPVVFYCCLAVHYFSNLMSLKV